MNKKENELIKKALTAKDMAYAPYSKFRVGAALLCSNNKVYTGCNVENSSFGATCCAERVAVYKALSEGNKEFKEIAIVSDSEGYIYPCGICRQVLSEFNSNIKIISSRKNGETVELSLNDLFSHQFKL